MPPVMRPDEQYYNLKPCLVSASTMSWRLSKIIAGKIECLVLKCLVLKCLVLKCLVLKCLDHETSLSSFLLASKVAHHRLSETLSVYFYLPVTKRAAFHWTIHSSYILKKNKRMICSVS